MAQIIHDVDLPNTGNGDPLRTSFVNQNEMNTELYETKVDKVTGKDLSANDFTDILKTKLDGIEDGAEVNVQSDWSQADNTADDYIKNKPETFISYPYKGNFPHVGSNVFTMPDGVAVLDVRPCGAGSFIGWSQLGTTLTFSDYTLQTGDYLIVIGIFNDANIFSPLGGVSSVTDDGNTVVVVDIADPLNPIITFDGVITDGTTIGGSGTLLDPLNVIGGGGGGGGTWGSIIGTLSDQTDLQAALDLKAPKNNPTFTGSVVVPNAVNSNEPMALGQYVAVVQSTSFVDVYSSNKLLTPADNQKTIFMDSGTLTINPSTQSYQDGYAVAVKSSGVANTPLTGVAEVDWTYVVNGGAAVASVSLNIPKGYTCTIIKKATLKIFSIDGTII